MCVGSCSLIFDIHDVLSTRGFECTAAVQADAGAQVVQIFDSWASQLSPQDFEIFSAPYIKQIIEDVRKVNSPLLKQCAVNKADPGDTPVMVSQRPSSDCRAHYEA